MLTLGSLSLEIIPSINQKLKTMQRWLVKFLLKINLDIFCKKTGASLNFKIKF
jgi:hypothetical protein